MNSSFNVLYFSMQYNYTFNICMYCNSVCYNDNVCTGMCSMYMLQCMYDSFVSVPMTCHCKCASGCSSL